MDEFLANLKQNSGVMPCSTSWKYLIRSLRSSSNRERSFLFIGQLSCKTAEWGRRNAVPLRDWARAIYVKEICCSASTRSKWLWPVLMRGAIHDRGNNLVMYAFFEQRCSGNSLSVSSTIALRCKLLLRLAVLACLQTVETIERYLLQLRALQQWEFRLDRGVCQTHRR